MDKSKDLDKNGIIGGHIYKDVYTPMDRYKYKQQLDGKQHPPSKIKHREFKQDYTVFIRKKKYYAVNQSNDELYLKVYQINNFMSLSTSHSVTGRPGTCKVTLKGGEKVIVADKKDADKKWGNFEKLKMGWNDQINESDQLTKQLGQYYWRYAEKADWEPMDEIYVFAKSRYIKGYGSDKSKYKFVQIFFGYITRISKSYQSAAGGMTITIEAEDHLKLLNISRMFSKPPLDMATGGVGVRFDGFGSMIIEDSPEELQHTYDNVFAGAYPHEIIRTCALSAGIPHKYLTKRIEPIMRIPFQPQISGDTPLFRGEMQTRLQYCQLAASKLNLEFFADEEGNIVLKIPSYAVGINRLPDNFEGDKTGELLKSQPQYVIEKVPIKQTQQVVIGNTNDVIHVVKRGDTLWDIAKKYLGSGARWREIWNLNATRIKSGKPELIYPGEKLIVKKGNKKTITKEVIVGYKEVKKEINKPPLVKLGQGPLSKNDYYIKIIPQEDIISFTLTDSDQDVYTVAEVTAEVPYIQSSMQQAPMAIKRTVSDFDLIRQFGYRPLQNNTTPIVADAKGAEIYANLLILRSISNRYSAVLQMIEEPSIRVGDPIRFFAYDEHPFTELESRDTNPAQAVYYVEAIDRQINANGQVSTMTLMLKAGRAYGMPSIYDQCTELFRYYYEEVNTPDPNTIARNAEKVQKTKNQISKVTSKTYIVKRNQTLSHIALEVYGDASLWPKIWNANKKTVKNPNLIYPGQKLIIP